MNSPDIHSIGGFWRYDECKWESLPITSEVYQRYFWKMFDRELNQNEYYIEQKEAYLRKKERDRALEELKEEETRLKKKFARRLRRIEAERRYWMNREIF